MLDLGVNKTDIDLNMDSLYSINRRLIDPEANRYFFVWNPVELEIKGKVPLSAKAPLHPTQNRGFREIPAGNTLFVCKNDLDRLRPGDNIRLKDLCNIQILSVKPAMARFMGIELLPKMTIVHWAPKNGIPIKVAMPDGTSNNGVGELGIAGELGKVVQFERFGFVRIHRIGDSIVAYYTHR
jgi:glutamyl-tRNA synthetase